MTLEDYARIGTLTAALVAAVTLIVTIIRAVYEYKKQNRLARFEKYSELSNGWSEDKNIQEIRGLLENDPQERLRNIHHTNREEFVAVFEEIALMMESGLIEGRIAYYMFGYYAILCEKNTDFWHDLDRSSHYWTLFFRFADKMKKIDADIRSGREKIEKWRFRF